MKQWETTEYNNCQCCDNKKKKKCLIIFITDLIKVQHLSAYTPVGPADVSITQSITLDFGNSWHQNRKKVCWAHSMTVQLYRVSLQEVNSII